MDFLWHALVELLVLPIDPGASSWYRRLVITARVVIGAFLVVGVGALLIALQSS